MAAPPFVVVVHQLSAAQSGHSSPSRQLAQMAQWQSMQSMPWVGLPQYSHMFSCSLSCNGC